VDCGKSTTGGHLLYLTGAVSKDLVNKCERESAQMGKATFKYSWIMFKLRAEKERGITIILSYNRFQTEKYDFTLIDTPGHRDLIKSTIVGTSQGDVGLLVVAAPLGEF
jgi:elongation factor 1-alpha